MVEVLIPLQIWLPRVAMEEAATTPKVMAVDAVALGVDRRAADGVAVAMEAHHLALFARCVARMATLCL
jgi:hypothetical protein